MIFTSAINIYILEIGETMNKYTFATQRGKAYYCNSIPGFLQDNPDSIIGALVRNSFENNVDQNDAWRNQIEGLMNNLKDRGIEGDIIFEYDIIRLGKRIDVILLVRHMVFSLEFKNGAKFFLAQDARQAEDYALDIKNFHKESEDLYVCPILVATNANCIENQSDSYYEDKQIYLQKENMESVIPKVEYIARKYGSDEKLNFDKWFDSPYFPTPTIISAAVEAYKNHSLTAIAQSEAGQDGIENCEKSLFSIIEMAKNNNKKVVCFITGVPGAGKTLVGLDVVTRNLEKKEDMLSVYISGNGPLVEVLQEALIKSTCEEYRRKGELDNRRRSEIQESVKALIQGSYGFKRDNVKRLNPTVEHIVVFDEAQRVWNKEKMKQKHKDPDLEISEPNLLYRIMDRHKDWAVLVCLVGLGQDIYDGEVGINEWFRCGIEEYDSWEMYYSPQIFNQTEDRNIDKKSIDNCIRCHSVDGLHLQTSIRSFRADKQNQFVDALLDNNPTRAKEVLEEISKKYPVYITRDINVAKTWVRGKVRGTQRSGVLACSSAQRLKPEGIYVPTNIDVKNWFLAPSDDLRSSNMLEVVASEFKVQGLEIDWAVVCWDADLRRKDNNWDYYSFKGTKWNHRNRDDQKRYLINSYRVLLTRARQGMIIFIPKGVDPEIDATRDRKYYDAIYEYLLSCGIEEIKD